MHLKYVGHKPVISHTGVDFSIGKEDKYIYIEPAAQMLHFLDKLDTNTKSVINPNKILDENEVFDILYKHRPDFDIFHKQHASQYEKKLDKEMLEVTVQNNLQEIEKEVLINNLKFMKEYRLQRVTNKLVYEELINSCVDLIREKGIVEIDMPFSLTFVHVASSFESSLALINRGVVAKVEVMIDRQQPYTRFSVNGFGNN